MRLVAHISDLHFGAEDPAPAKALLADLISIRPSLVIVSGDLTQRARCSQFIAARSYLDQIPFPKLVIPGNHDVPLYDVFRRFLAPLRRYQNLITPDLNPFFRDEEMAILGINTARSLTWKSGRIGEDQIQLIEQRFISLPGSMFKIIVTHHPFIPPPGEEAAGIDLVGRAAEAIVTIDKCCIDLLLAGHLHHGYTGDVRTYYPATKRSVVVAQAGTAISHRLRNEPNGYNLITLDGEFLRVDVRVWRENQFKKSLQTNFKLRDSEWILEK